MLSPGKYHLDVPRDLEENLKVRLALVEYAEGRPDRQCELRQMCKDDVLFWINCFVWQFNPSLASKGSAAIQPFISYPIQDRVLCARPETHREFRPYDRGMLWCYENEKTLAIEKSRWQGASWLQLIFQDWLCLFHPYVQTLNISRNEAAVDDGTKDSLFWKLRYMHSHMPRWMTGEISDSKLYFHFHRTDSEATGTASTKRAGVGGRASLVNVDEYPEIERAQEVREKTAMTANCRIFTGTHLGVGTPFQVMCDPRQSPEIVRQRMHWSDNPEQNPGLYEFDPKNPHRPILHDESFRYADGFQFVLDGSPTGGPRPGVRSPWYDRKCIDIGDSRAIAMNLDISPEGAAKQFFDGLKIRNIIAESARPPVWVGDVMFDRMGKLDRIVEEAGGPLQLWVLPRGDGKLPASDYFVGNDISTGMGASPSCSAGIDGRRSMKVMEYANARIEERDFAQLSMALCELLSSESGQGAKLSWDGSGPTGSKFEQELLRLGYRNVYYNDEDLPSVSFKRTRRPGWFGQNQQKWSALKDYRNDLYSRRLIDRSERCLLETLLFEIKEDSVSHAGEKRSNDPSGAKKFHGDLVTATMIAWVMAKEMAEGGKRSVEKTGEFEVGSLGWLLALESNRKRRLEEEYY